MIAVIADDLSGAAEIAGIGLRYGLKCEVHTESIPDSHPDLLIIDTNTRSASISEARRIVKEVVLGLPKHVHWIYKKTDSVFRGHVAAELETLLDTLGIPSALLVPANPSMGRIIIDGIYYVNGCPLKKTHFSRDPESAYTSSNVVKLLNASSGATVLNCDSVTRNRISGIVIGNADQPEHMKEWTFLLQDDILPAGGADFFTAILDGKGFQCCETEIRDEFPTDGKVLIVQGIGSQFRHNAENEINNPKSAVNQLEFTFADPEQLNARTLKQWNDRLLAALRENRAAVIRFKTENLRTSKMNQTLARFTGDLIVRLFQQIVVPHIIVEGGTTASTIVRRMNWTRWTPIQVFDPGTVRMREVESGVTLSVKPGSYPWPESIEKMFYSPSY